MWSFTPGVGFGPDPHRTSSIVFDEATERWHAMGHQWNDEANLLLYLSENGLDGWQPAPYNPVILYDERIPKSDDDWYVQRPNYGRYPDSTMKMADDRRVVVVNNHDGNDSHLQWLTSQDGFIWDERGDVGVIVGPYGSGDPGDQWPSSLIFNPDDETWYLFYHGGGESSVGRGRTVGVAMGPSPDSLEPWNGYFEDSEMITQNALVLRDASGWLMVYQHGFSEGDGIWYARSPDLLHWEPQGQILEGEQVSLHCWAAIPNDNETITWRIYLEMHGELGVFEATVPRL